LTLAHDSLSRGQPSQRLDVPFFSAIANADYASLTALFPDLASCKAPCFLALRPLLHNCPERFFDRQAYSLFLDWLKKRDTSDRKSLQAYFSNNSLEIDAALHFLRQINSEDWHDDPIKSGDNYGDMRLVDKVLHPAYLRLSEAVLAPLLRLPTYFSRLDLGKGTDKLDVFNVVEDLSKTPFSICTKYYEHVIRNGIGHGGVTYLHAGIRYQDKKGGSKTVSVRDFIRLFDDLLDTCNGLAAALKVFFVTHTHHGYELPREFLIEELREDTRSPWWAIEGCIESEIPRGKQLLIYASPNSRDSLKIRWAAIYTAMIAESLAPGYQRYFVSLSTSKNSWGWAAFDGDKISEIRRSGTTQVHHYVSAFEDVGFCYEPKSTLPRIFCRIETFIGVMRSHKEIMRTQVRNAMGFPKIVCRDATIHRNSWGYVLNGVAVISKIGDEPISHTIRKFKRRILRKVVAAGKASASMLDTALYLPLGFARISVYSEDYRRRRFDGFGLERQLICTIQIRRIRRIKTLDILGSTIEIKGNWRIAWNKEWIAHGSDL
jgi:hypothetical protein